MTRPRPIVTLQVTDDCAVVQLTHHFPSLVGCGSTVDKVKIHVTKLARICTVKIYLSSHILYGNFDKPSCYFWGAKDQPIFRKFVLPVGTGGLHSINVVLPYTLLLCFISTFPDHCRWTLHNEVDECML